MNTKFMSGVGIAALAGALVATPAYASDSEDGSEFRLQASAETEGPAAPVAVAAPAMRVGTFNGLEQRTPTVNLDTVNLRVARNSEGVVATLTRPTQEIISRTDVGLAGSVDVNNTVPSAVQIFSQRNSDGGVFFNCTGSVINPRTILTAAHCVTAETTRSSEAYGLPGTGAERTQLIATGVDSSTRLFNYLDFGSSYSEGGLASSTDVVIHASSNLDNGALPFALADIALIAVDEPITDVPALPLLLTPLTELTHVVHVGYGTFGTAETGETGIGFLRRIGTNMLGAIASGTDLVNAALPAFAPTGANFGVDSQAFYFTDFDNPDRTQADLDACDIVDGFITCFGDTDEDVVRAITSIDWFQDDATDNEAATAPGDSGSALIADQLADFPLALGVLSGGYGFFGDATLPGTYGDISFYNPLYNYFEFITENTAYKYVSAAEGDGVWSDASRWTQDLDPGFFIQLETGEIVNGVPTGSERGVYETGPKLGTILGNDISGNPDDQSALLPPEEDNVPNFGVNTPNSSALLGPGSTGFVPQNTDGTAGTAFANPAQYFEVHLNRAGTTTVDMDVEIDKLVLNNANAGLVLPSAWDFTTLIDVEHLDGSADIDGTLSTPLYVLGFGSLSGDGTINTNALFNIAGGIVPGGDGSVGTLTVNGDYLQTAAAGLVSDFDFDRRRNVSSDLLDISGLAVLDGTLIVTTNSPRARFGAEFTVLSADEIDGAFSDVILFSRSPVLAAEANVVGGDVVVKLTARSIRDLLGRRSPLESLGASLDTMRGSRFTDFVGLFDVIDNTTVDSFGATLSGLTPTSAFQQTFTANSFSQRFTGQIAQRTLSLRGGSRAAGGFSAAGNASYALNGTTPAETGKLGVFGSASGVYLNSGQPMGFGNAFEGPLADGFASGTVLSNGGANALEQATLAPAGELTIGADVQVSEGFSFGVAMSRIQSSELSTSALRPQEDTSNSMAVYMTYSEGGLFADAYAGTADQQFGVQRAAQGDLSSLFRNAIGQSDGSQTFGGLRLGYAFDLAKGVEVGPVASFDYLRSNIDGYTELGMGDFSLSVAGRDFTSLGAKVGAMASVDVMASSKTAIRAFGSVAYARELADTADVVTAHFAGAPEAAFTIANQLDPSWVSVNAGAEMQVGANLTASVSVTSDMGRGLLSNDQGQVSLNWRF